MTKLFESPPDETPEELEHLSHERVVKMHGAYTAFIAAAVISLISGDGHLRLEGWSICLWTLSLPPLITLLLLDYIVRVCQRRKASGIRGLMTLLGYGLSNLGTAALMFNFSWVAAGAYLFSVLLCALLLHVVSSFGWFENFKEL